MVASAEKPVARLLTDVELELMTILWRLGAGTVNDVRVFLPPDRSLAYSTVSTMLRILDKKGFLEAHKRGRNHVFVPSVSKGAYEAHCLDDLINRVFDGTPVALVQRLLESQRVSTRDLTAMRVILDRSGGR